MRAIICKAYGPPETLSLTELEDPIAGPRDVLIKVHASTVTYGDCELRTLTLPLWTRIPVRMIMGYRKPKRYIPGMEFSGVIEAVGKEVARYKPGDAVFGSTGMAMGGNAEYLCRSGKAAFGLKPANVSFEEAATIPVGGINALFFLRKANVQPGQRVLVIGGGGCIGSWAVLLARHYGAEVTAVDHTMKLDMLRAIGTHHVIDYTREDFSAHGVKYDVILDTVYASSYSKCVATLAPRGVYLMANTGPRRMIKGLLLEMYSRKKVMFQLAYETEGDLNFLADLISQGKVKPVIDRVYPLEGTPDAHRYVEQGLKKGSVIIKVN